MSERECRRGRCEIEEELSRYCVETANRIPVNARHFIMARVATSGDPERGGRLAQASCPGGDKDDHRGALGGRHSTCGRADVPGTTWISCGAPRSPPVEFCAADCRHDVRGGTPGGCCCYAVPTRPSAIVPDRGPTLHEHVAFVTPIAPSAAPARDSLRLLKANIDPAAHDIRDVTLRQTRYGLTVLAHSRDTLTNMRQAIADNAITCAALSMRIPEKRNPHVRFSGVDPDITSEEFISRVAERNTHLQLDADKCKVRASFKERSGTSAFIVEVDPDAFARIMRQPRLSAYADDTIILVPAPTRSALGDLASEVLRRVASWSRTVKRFPRRRRDENDGVVGVSLYDYPARHTQRQQAINDDIPQEWGERRTLRAAQRCMGLNLTRVGPDKHRAVREKRSQKVVKTAGQIVLPEIAEDERVPNAVKGPVEIQ
ncbi:hypothetical protein HPB52_023732 [Rhipicephalus sanguineus]|uniref:Uncharacterized protein n=1 Tax=Rhipicephalus sanguineus TaxID=34632 RepID=A0A9D4Q3V5_RHISA|nr:hypothetical protein HPB52_023732 [Rhipicephalus sanguineus]